MNILVNRPSCFNLTFLTLSLCLYLCLCLSLSLYLSISVSLSLSLCLCLCLCLLFLSLSLSLCVCVCVCVCVRACVCLYLWVCKLFYFKDFLRICSKDIFSNFAGWYGTVDKNHLGVLKIAIWPDCGPKLFKLISHYLLYGFFFKLSKIIGHKK